MKKYKVIITETLEREIEVEATDKIEAKQIVEDAWRNSEYILDADDFTCVNFKAEELSDD
ncbi:MAG: DpnD/PcfM family protein [Ruminococcus sp.]|nr:DpnD/PcfM family protein [Ruminococcus sp.]